MRMRYTTYNYVVLAIDRAVLSHVRDCICGAVARCALRYVVYVFQNAAEVKDRREKTDARYLVFRYSVARVSTGTLHDYVVTR